MKTKLLAAVLAVFTVLTLAVSSASADGGGGGCKKDCPPPPPCRVDCPNPEPTEPPVPPPTPPPTPQGCNELFQGWEGNVRVGGPVFQGGEIYRVSVTQTPSNCVRIKTHFFKRVARQFIRFDTVAPLADPAVWEVEVLS